MKQDNEHRPAYLRLYERLRGEIVRGDYPFGARMPSKRQLAEEEGLSVVTVEHAYALLTDEGYLEARRRSGHYVQFHDTDGFVPSAPVRPAAVPAGERADFPFSVLSRVMRRVFSEYGEQLLEKSPNNGCDALRQAMEMAAVYDAAPDAHGNALRFVSDDVQQSVYDDLGESAMQGVWKTVDAMQCGALGDLWKELSDCD